MLLFVLFLLLQATGLFSACGGDEEPAPTLEFPSAQLPAGTERQPYTAQLEAQGGTPPYRFELSLGQMPYGVRIDAETGALTGTPSQAGVFTFSIRVRDAAGQSASREFTVPIEPWNIPARIGCGETATVSLTESALAGEGGYQFQSTAAVAFFALTVPPAGTTSLGIRASSQDGDPAIFVGRPGQPPGSELAAYYYHSSSRPGDDEVRIHAESNPSISAYLSAASDIAVVLAAATPGEMELSVTCGTGAVLATPFLPNARAGEPYQASLHAIAGTPPYAFEALSGLPEGLALLEDGTVVGTLPAPGSHAIEVRVTDAFGLGETRRLSLWVPEVLPLTCGGTASIDFDTWAFNGQQGLATEGGAAFLELAVPERTSGVTLELEHGDGFTVGLFQGRPGMSAGSSRLEEYVGEVFDTPGDDPDPVRWTIDGRRLPTLEEYAGLVPLALAAQDGFGAATVRATCTTALEVASWSLPNGAMATPYAVALEAAGGQGSYRWESVGPLPAGLLLSSGGVLNGTPVASGRFSIQARVRDDAGASATRSLELIVGEIGSQPCGLATRIGCGEFKSGTLTSSAWVDRVEVDFSSPAGAALFCVTFPAETSSLSLALDSLTGDTDLFLGYAGASPGDLEPAHYRTFSSDEGDDSIQVDGESFPPLDAYDGVAAVAVPAWEAGSFLLSLVCD